MFPTHRGASCKCDEVTDEKEIYEDLINMNVLFTKQQAHDEIECVFRELLPQNGMAQRPEQIRLCHSMLDAMLDGSIALCDAGTGIGKTFAYLVAGIMLEKYRSAEGEPRRPVLISTSSIALQNAIQNEYLPFLSSVLLAHGLIDRPIQAVIRKGKSHYACDMRLDRRIRQVKMSHKNPKAGYALLSAKQVLDLDKLSGMSGYDRERVRVPQHCACGKENCRYRRFLEECRNGQYTIQICNHNLLLADMIHRSRQKRPILRDSAVYIIDEAHKLPETARQMFGVTLAADDLTDLIRRLRTERFVLAAELLAESAQPLLDKLSTPVEEGEDFEAYRTLLESPHHILTVIHRQLNRLLSGETWRCLMTVSAAVSLFCEGNQDMIFYDSTEWEKLYQAEASESILRDYAKTNSREYFADCFAYWVSYSGIEKHMEVFRNAAPQTYAYMEMLAASNWGC